MLSTTGVSVGHSRSSFTRCNSAAELRNDQRLRVRGLARHPVRCINAVRETSGHSPSLEDYLEGMSSGLKDRILKPLIAAGYTGKDVPYLRRKDLEKIGVPPDHQRAFYYRVWGKGPGKKITIIDNVGNRRTLEFQSPWDLDRFLDGEGLYQPHHDDETTVCWRWHELEEGAEYRIDKVIPWFATLP